MHRGARAPRGRPAPRPHRPALRRALSDVFFRDLDLPEPDVNLGVGSGSHAARPPRCWSALEPVFADLAPGARRSSTATSTPPSPRRWSRPSSASRSPTSRRACAASTDTMPEEINRRVTDALSDLLFVTSPEALDNLARRGRPRRAHALRREPHDRHAAGATSTASTRRRSRARLRPPRALRRRHAPPAGQRGRPAPRRAWSRRCGASPTSCRSSAAPPPGPGDAGGRRASAAPAAARRSTRSATSTSSSLVRGAAVVVTDSGGIQEETTSSACLPDAAAEHGAADHDHPRHQPPASRRTRWSRPPGEVLALAGG